MKDSKLTTLVGFLPLHFWLPQDHTHEVGHDRTGVNGHDRTGVNGHVQATNPTTRWLAHTNEDLRPTTLHGCVHCMGDNATMRRTARRAGGRVGGCRTHLFRGTLGGQMVLLQQFLQL